MKDSIFGIEKRRIITNAQVKFETEKIKRAKIFAENKSIQNRNYFIAATIIFGLLLIVFFMLFKRNNARKKAEIIRLELKETQKRLAIEKQYRQSELKALKAQMDPHFIFNALNSIQEYIVLNQKNLASDYLGKFADLMRKYLKYSDRGSISLQEEMNCLRIYLELEKIRFEEKLNYTLVVSENLDLDSICIPTMLIQPYVENALKHGLLHKKGDREIIISIDETNTDKQLICSIYDNGIGRKKARELKKKRANFNQSFATKATQSRLELLNFGRTHKIGFVIEDLYEVNMASGTRVTVTIPYTTV